MKDRIRGGSEHSRHDRLLVSRFGAADAFPAEIDEARQLVASCADCARLAADIKALRSATAALPAPRRTRDFRITAEQAESLRGSALQRWLRRLAAPGLAPLRPLAGVAMSVGLVLVVAGVALPTPVGDMTALDVTRYQQAPGAQPDGAGAPPEATGAPAASPASIPEGPVTGDAEKNPEPVTTAEEIGLGAELERAETTRGLLIVAGLLISVLSLGVLLLVLLARRRATDPLLR